MKTVQKISLAVSVLLIAANPFAVYAEDVTLLNVSYDPTRELYQEFNAAFAKYWQKEKAQTVVVKHHTRY